MILSAEKLDTYDRCERRFAFARAWESRSISPLGLLYSALESALTADDPEQEAKDRTMEIAREFTLDADHNAFMMIRHIGYLAGIIALALRAKLGPLAPVEISATEDFLWESALLQTSSGVRHRIELVSHWDDDRLRQSAHSWRVVGELAALQTPLTLTAVVIGPQRAGRRHSAWAKGVLHPQNHALRFQKRSGEEFSGAWGTVWRDQSQIPTEDWLRAMARDGVMESLILSREIAFNPSDNRMIAARREMGEIAERMESASEAAPMRRSSCDEVGRGACAFQSICYSPVDVKIESLDHLYRRRPNAAQSAEGV